MTWEEAYNRSLKLTRPDEGFYLAHKVSPCSDIKSTHTIQPKQLSMINNTVCVPEATRQPSLCAAG